jgi:cytochrome P450
MRERLLERARAILSAAAVRQHLDVVADFAYDLPLWLLCQFLCLPVDARDEIGAFLVGTEEAFAEPMTDERRQRAEDGIVSLYAYVEALIEQRLEEPGADLVSDLLAAEQRGQLSRPELLAMVVNVIGGAVGSTRAGIANSVLLLLSHPDQARWVRADPGRVRPAIEECLRYYPPFRGGRRKVVAATSQFGLELEPGDTLYVARSAANRDPKRWADPDHFDVSRQEQRHYSFGYGPHFCLGQALARLDIQTAIQAVLERFDDLELLDARPRRVPYVPDEQLVALPVAVRNPTRSVVA